MNSNWLKKSKANRKTIDNSLGFNIRVIHNLILPKPSFIKKSEIKKVQKQKKQRLKNEHRQINIFKNSKKIKNKKINKKLKQNKQIQNGFDIAIKWKKEYDRQNNSLSE